MPQDFTQIKVFPSGDEKGINLREFIAAHALQGVVAGAGPTGIVPDFAAQKAIEFTEALIAKLYARQTNTR